jgi:hypothetical protein
LTAFGDISRAKHIPANEKKIIGSIRWAVLCNFDEIDEFGIVIKTERSVLVERLDLTNHICGGAEVKGEFIE